MKTFLELHIPNIIINPSLDEIQSSFTHVLANILKTHRAVCMWGQRSKEKVSIDDHKVQFGSGENGNDITKLKCVLS